MSCARGLETALQPGASPAPLGTEAGFAIARIRRGFGQWETWNAQNESVSARQSPLSRTWCTQPDTIRTQIRWSPAQPSAYRAVTARPVGLGYRKIAAVSATAGMREFESYRAHADR